MITPGACLVALRGALVFGGAATVAALLGFFALPAGLDGTAARAAALYVVSLLAFAALPRMRRDDLAGAVAGLACVAEAFHAVTAHHVSLVPLAADLVGVIAAWTPATVEQYRRLAREARYVPFRDLANADRRSRTRVVSASTVAVR